ncbi:MAG: AMP-binding protein, partial [bacterium]|nr:AMP-binding protein [bacterium]
TIIHLEDKTYCSEDSSDPPAFHSPRDVSHILYTSGTTGVPKGVMLENRSMVNLIFAALHLVDLREDDNFVTFTPVTFDVLTSELVMPLSRGSKIVIGDEETIFDQTGAIGLVRKECITIYQATPAGLQIVVSDPALVGGLRKLRYLLSAGEALPEALLEKLQNSTDAVIYNFYGPTEATIYSTAKEVTRETVVTIGKPINNTSVHILDKKGELLPVGIAGELCVGGLGVGRGYMNRPELTAEKFLDFSHVRHLNTDKINTDKTNTDKTKLYKTGDLARWREDGNIEYIGRIDHQVKVGGMRIEPGEIENILLVYDGIDEAVVVVKENENNEIYLCAYVISKQRLRVAGLRIWLAGKVPHYMIPAIFIQLEKMPLTPNRKVNRKLLAGLEIQIDATGNYIAPQNEIEETTVNNWAESLDIPKEAISIDANFFELGGHSLRAIKITDEMHKAFNIKVPLAEMFKKPTVKQLAEYIKPMEEETVVTKDKRLVLLKREPNLNINSARNLFFIHDVSGEVNEYMELCNRLNKGFNCWGIRLAQKESIDFQTLTVESIAAKYIQIIKKVQPVGPYFVSGWSLGGTIAFEIVRQLEQQNELIGFLGLIDATPPDDLALKLKGTGNNSSNRYRYRPDNPLKTSAYYFEASQTGNDK